MPSSFGLGRQSTPENLAGLKQQVSYYRQLTPLSWKSRWWGTFKESEGNFENQWLGRDLWSEGGGGLRGVGEA